ncbi:variable large family protein, partial [Borreliella garinii]|uniref:variable large family protein n=1 Tax=Borreliella garinii TaxID=29519 RepID=UPI001AEDF9FE
IADDKSVKGIAGGMKAIVEVAEKVEGVKFEPEEAVDAADGDGNKDAGKLFAIGGPANANADAINKAAKAVSGVSGDQILNAIVTSDSNGNGANARA